MSYALFYSIMQHMCTWGYVLRKDAQPCLVLEYVENMIEGSPKKEETGILINLDMDRFMGNTAYSGMNPELIVHPTLEDLFVKEPISNGR